MIWGWRLEKEYPETTALPEELCEGKGEQHRKRAQAAVDKLALVCAVLRAGSMAPVLLGR